MESNDSRHHDELYSQVVSAGKRKYFVDVKATKGGDKYITLTESRKLFDNTTGNMSFEKNKLFLYREDFEKFRLAMSNAFDYIETGVIPEEKNLEGDTSSNRDDSSIVDGIDFSI